MSQVARDVVIPHQRAGPHGPERICTVRSFARSTASLSILAHPGDDTEWERLFDRPHHRGVTVRGAGASYSDAALNSGGTVAETTGEHRIRSFAVGTGIVDVDAGTAVADLLTACVPWGWTLPVLPGTAHLTVGGALAADVHGKNHLTASSFAAHVLQVVLLTPGAGVLVVGPDQDPDAFWTTAGGLGLTGVVRRVRLQLVPVSSAWMLIRDTAAPDLENVLTLMREAAPAHAHVVAWLDGHAAGRATGRGIVTTADHLLVGDLPARLAAVPLRYRPARTRHLPWTGLDLVRPGLVRSANALRYAGTRRRPPERISDLSHALHPLDAVTDWSRLYGGRGLVQYQFSVPDTETKTLGSVLRALQAGGCPPSLVVLKRLGSGTPGPLSFPSAGWTMALDLPTGPARAASAVLDRLDDLVVACGGRVNLVKDSRMRHALVPRMYPRLQQWRTVRDRLDPAGVMSSDLDRRLRLSGRSQAGERS